MADDLRPILPPDDPNQAALQSIDAIYHADASPLNEEVGRLRRFVRIRRPLYYSVLFPFAALSRMSAVLVLLTAALAAVASPIALIVQAPTVVSGLLMYWGLGGLSYHAVSVRLAALMNDAALSVGATSEELLERWKA
ncbi:MAG: hypothetical protein HKN80_00565 [Acidimicrobiia bacterium]|nr:hypothetical protein [Acidimicrobiia bacterium]